MLTFLKVVIVSFALAKSSFSVSSNSKILNFSFSISSSIVVKLTGEDKVIPP